MPNISSDYAKNRAMKSERAKQYLLKVVAPMYPDCPEECDLKLIEAKRAVELAEQDAEMRMREKAHKIIKEMMEGVFQGNMPQNIADEFSQKLNEE